MPAAAPVSIDFDQPFDVQVAQARARGVLLPHDYYGLITAEKRAQSITVSNLAKLDQVQRIADKLAKAQGEGTTLRDFQKWAATQEWGLPKHHLETIYRNAVQTAYQAGHWRDFEAGKAERPYLMYDAINDSRTRPAHLAMDGIIKPVDDVFWDTHSPQCGHRCRCRLRSLNRREAMAKGGATQSVPPDANADAGWGGKPTDGFKGLLNSIENRLNKCRVNMAATFANVRGNVPLWCTDGPFKDHLLSTKAWALDTGQLPQPQRITPLEKIHGGSAEKAFERFMQEFGATDSVEFVPVLGKNYRLLIDDDLFKNKDKSGWKIKNEGRQLRILYNAAAIKAPDEIVFEPSRNGSNEFLWFFARYEIERGLILSTVATFERKAGSAHIWAGNTAYNSLQEFGAENVRNREIVNGSVLYHQWK